MIVRVGYVYLHVIYPYCVHMSKGLERRAGILLRINTIYDFSIPSGHYLDQKQLKQGLYRHPWDDISYISPDMLQ